MRHTLLGRTGLHVSSVSLGTMTFGTSFGIGDGEQASREAFDLYLDRGGNFVDTANIYNHGETEDWLGRWMEGKRDGIVLSTKYSVPIDQNDLNAGGNGRKSLVQSLDASLKRLNTDHIDLYWVHLWDGFTPEDEVLRALDDAVSQGKVVHVGFSDHPAWLVARIDALAEASRMIRPAAIQIEYNLAQRDADREYLPMAARLGMGVVAWGPLAGGALTGKYLDGGAGKGRVGGEKAGHYTIYRDERTARIARAVVDGANDMGISPAALATAWISARSPLLIPIVGARNAEQLGQTLDAVDLAVPADVMAKLEEVSALPLGFPLDFLHENQGRMFKKMYEEMDPRARARGL